MTFSERVCVFATVLAIGVAVLRLVGWTVTKQVSFDGAMNLEVARSLAEGHGYVRLYADHSGFSHEIQSRAPYILPAAAVFAIFGVGVWQSQLVNLLYVGALAALAFALVRRWTSWRWGLFAVAVFLWTPGIREIAMNGYGEVPALVWWLGAVLVLCDSQDTRVGAARWFWAGVLAGMAVLTKTVLAIGLIAIVPVVVAVLAAQGFRARSVVAGTCALAVGIALPGILYELAHIVAIADIARWQAWVGDEMQAIDMQAGTANGFKDTHGFAAKIAVHARLLADSMGLPLSLLPLWIAAPIAAVLLARRGFAAARARAAMLGLAVFATIYFVWWLGFTPTEKAWYRRIFNGVIVLEIVLVVVLAALWNLRQRAAGLSRHAASAACAVLIALQLVVSGSNAFSGDDADFATRESLERDLAAVQRVPMDKEIQGVGWYSAPTIALYSGRRIGNIVTKTPAELAAASPVYLALDMPAMHVGAGRYWLDRYSYRDVAHSDTLWLVAIDANAPTRPFDAAVVDPKAVLGRVDFQEADYPYVFGFQGREGDGWRWASGDAEVLLRYRGEAELNVDIYLPPMQGYRARRDVGITVWADACRLGTFRQDESRRERWWLPARHCLLTADQLVSVRLVSDNLYASRDNRQLAYIVRALGFADPAPAGDQR